MPGDTRSLELLWIRADLLEAVLFLGALYYPLRPIYRVEVLMKRLEQSVETLFQMESSAIVVLGGDLNRLDEREVVACTGLTPHINEPTKGENILDGLYVSEQCFSTVRILASAIKTDHKATIALSTGRVTSQPKEARRVAFRKRTPQQRAALLRELTDFDLSHILTNNRAAGDVGSILQERDGEIGKVVSSPDGHNDKTLTRIC